MSEAAVNEMPVGAAVPGWFGKIPNLGDFVSRRLPEEFVRGWDDWLQHGIAKAQAALRDDWLARYLVAPVRRFWVAPGVLGEAAWAGVMMPSVDAVGRHFPLTIAMPLGPGPASLAAALAAHAWFDAIDAAARQVLDVHFSADDLEHALEQVAPLPLGAAADGNAAAEEDSDTAPLAETLLGPFRRNDASRESAALKPCSFWWCGHASPASEVERFAALPPAASFALLLVAPAASADAARAASAAQAP